MATLADFTPKEEVREDSLVRLQRLSSEAGMRQVAADLSEEIRQERLGKRMEATFRAGQHVWWFPPGGSRPAFMARTERMVAATVVSVNVGQKTVLIEHLDITHRKQQFLASTTDLVKREVPGRCGHV